MTLSQPGEFCAEIRDRLVGSLTLYCGDRAVAEELAQDALVRTWEHWSRVRTMDAPEAWTFRTATNLANSWYRRRAAERRAKERLRGQRTAHHDPPDGSTAEVVRAAVAALPPKQRAVVIARFFLDLSVDQTATALGCAPGTVKATTSHAVARLRAMGLTDDDTEVPSR